MLKKGIALILLVAFIAMTFSPAFVLLDFYANRDYIAKNLCENRDKPMKHCCGKCILKKKLQEEENKSKEEQRQEGFVKLVVPKTISADRCDPYTAISHSYRLIFSSGVPVDQPSSFFHPPGC